MTETVTWQPKQAALRDLFLLVLYRTEGHSISDDSGKVASILREKAGIPSSKSHITIASTVLLMMSKANYVTRMTNRGGKGTSNVTLARILSKEEIADIEAGEKANLLFFTDAPVIEEQTATVITHDDRYGLLFANVSKCLAAMRAAVARAERRRGRQAIINVSKIFRDLGIKGQRAEEVRYYLKELGFAYAAGRSDVQVNRFWLSWWEVHPDKVLDPEKLRAFASGDKSFQNYKANGGGRNPLEDGPRERQFAGRTPAVLPDALCSPVEVRRVEEVPASQPPAEVVEVAPPAKETVVARSGDRIADLLAIIEALEAGKLALEETLQRVNEEHKSEMDALRKQVAHLTEQLQAQASSAERADEVISRYLNK